MNKIMANATSRNAEFGIALDVDGVLTRGPLALPFALRISELLHDRNGSWRFPVLFLTNATHTTKENKATELSKILHSKILPSEIVTPHSVLKLYSHFFDKHVVFCGLGPLKLIARNIGFNRCSTIKDISLMFPWLDACKPTEGLYAGTIRRAEFNKVDAIFVLGEPDRWEQNLQIILDLLLQNGDLNKPAEASVPQLPLFACGSDLVWTTNAPRPRIALGSFLACLETLYERLTGRRLTYTGVLGKPSPLAYAFALSQLNTIASRRFGATQPLKRIYFIGDNPEVDIYGANLFNLCLQTGSEEVWNLIFRRVDSVVQEEMASLLSGTDPDISHRPPMFTESEKAEWRSFLQHSLAMPHVLRELVMKKPERSPPCAIEPVLVKSGVYQEPEGGAGGWKSLHRVHQGFPDLAHLYEPRLIAADAAEAVTAILALEGSYASPKSASINASANRRLP